MPGSNYRLIEPHPSVPRNPRPAIHTARGGAGNVINLRNTRTTPSQTATGPPSVTRLNSRDPTPFKTGRGGAGNIHSSGERAIFSFDEELERELRRAAPVYHVGRGGAGNSVYGSSSGSSSSAGSGSGSGNDTYSLTRSFSDGSTTTNSSSGSAGDRARDKALRGLERGWGKLKGMA